MRFLQLNLNHCEAAQDLFWQSTQENNIDVAILSDQYRDIEGTRSWLRDSTGKAALWFRQGVFVQEAQTTRRKGFVWARAAGTYICSVYARPGVSHEEFQRLLDELVEELRGRQPAIIAGDFNAWATDWGSRVTNRRGECVLDALSPLGVVSVNTGSSPTFMRNGRSSIIDVTFGSESLVPRVVSWKVSDHYTHSDHQAIIFQVVTSRGQINVENHRRRPWNPRSFDRDVFHTMLEDVTIPDGPSDRKVSQLMSVLSGACDASMTRRVNNSRRPAYWWNDEIAEVRRICLRSRRQAQRARGRASFTDLRDRYAEARRNLGKAIKASKLRCWRELCREVDQDPWGRPYKTVMARLRKQGAGTPSCPEFLDRIVRVLFPQQPADSNAATSHLEPDIREVPPVTSDELLKAVRRIGDGKTPGPDGIPNVALKAAMMARPDIFCGVYNACLKEGIFPDCWKRQHLVLLPKGDKPPDEPSSYRPICLLDTAGKVLERIIANRLEVFSESNQGLSANQYGFRKARSTIDAVRKVVGIASEAIKGSSWTRGSKKYCALVTLDVRNAFNSARWSCIMNALRRMQVPAYLRRIISNYFSNRVLTYDSDVGARSYKVTGGVPQGSVLGPLLWNIMYDEVLRLPMPKDSTTVGFADDVAVVVVGKFLEEVTCKANRAVFCIRQWLASVGLHLADHKTEVVLVTGRKTRETITLAIGECDVESQGSLRYLGVQIDAKLRFDEHIRIVSQRASRVMNALARIMPNTGGPRQSRRRLLSTVTSSILLYAAPTWATALDTASYARGMISVYRRSALRVACAYRTTSYDAVCVVADLPPIDLLADERCRIHRRRRTETGNNRTQIKEERVQTLKRWQLRWDSSANGRWTHRLIPDIATWHERGHGEVEFYVTQLLTGHGNFRAYLHRFGLDTSPSCPSCATEDESAEHIFFLCPRFTVEREQLNCSLQTRATPENLVTLMVQHEENWKAVADFAARVMKVLHQEQTRRRNDVGN